LNPSPEHLEREVEAVRRELDEALEEAKAIYRRLQDVDAEEPDNASAIRWLAEQSLRAIGRRIQLAQCELVPADDHRYQAAQRTAAELRRAA
jgi:signal transduction histidine kinase